jgi:hypothetical protein
VGDWLNNLPSELGYGLATSLVVAIGGWVLARLRRRRKTSENPNRQVPTEAALKSPVLAPATVPRLLPRGPQRFVNRQPELDALDELMARADDAPSPLVAVLSGMHGVGKSAIGSFWARRNHAHFTGGALSADFSRRRNPEGVEVSDVLADFLREMGISDVAMPTTLRDKQRLFERLTSDRKLLVLLDDVDQPAQALATLPSGPGSVVVVTSAFRLEELVRAGAQPVLLDPLDEAAAQDLLVDMAGANRINGEPVATGTVVAACGGLPIALCVCGARLATYPDRTVTWLASQLAVTSRLRTLSPPGDFDVSAVFAVAYDDLAEGAAALYRRLGLHPGPDFSPSAAAALAGAPLAEVAPLLEQFEGAYLLQGDGHGRLRPHDLVRDHMRACADDASGTATG